MDLKHHTAHSETPFYKLFFTASKEASSSFKTQWSTGASSLSWFDNATSL